jgi:hypothetical protein
MPAALAHINQTRIISCILIGIIGTMGCLSLPRRTKPTCPTPPTHTLNGWIEHIEDRCAWLVLSSKQHQFISRYALPIGAKEGDYIQHGILLPHKRQRDAHKTKQLLAEHHTLPPHFRLGDTPPDKRTKAIAKQPYKRGSWKHWQATRKQRRETKRKRRYSRRPWRR